MTSTVYTILAVLAVSALSLIGISFFLIKEETTKKGLLYFVSFSAGALLGDVFIHIIPEMSKEPSFISRSLYILLFGIVVSFIIEKVIHWQHCHDIRCEDHLKPIGIMNLIGDALHTFKQVPHDVLVPLPEYDSVKQSKSYKESEPSDVYSIAYLGSYATGSEHSGSHPGIDIRAPVGTPVLSIANGYISEVSDNKGGFGKVIVVRHPNVPDPKYTNGKTTTLYSVYSHLSAIYVTTGTFVQKGEKIGLTGKSGYITGAHLHFQIDREDAPWHPYWPFTGAEARGAGLGLAEAIDQGLHKGRAKSMTVNPMLFVQSHLTSRKPAMIVHNDSEDSRDNVRKVAGVEERIISTPESRRAARLAKLESRRQDRISSRMANRAEEEEVTSDESTLDDVSETAADKIALLVDSSSSSSAESLALDDEAIEVLISSSSSSVSSAAASSLSVPSETSSSSSSILSEASSSSSVSSEAASSSEAPIVVPPEEKVSDIVEDAVEDAADKTDAEVVEEKVVPLTIEPPTIAPSSDHNVISIDFLHNRNFSGRKWEQLRITLLDKDGKRVVSPNLRSDLYLRNAYGDAVFRPSILTELDFQDGVAEVHMLPRRKSTIIIQAKPYSDLSSPIQYEK